MIYNMEGLLPGISSVHENDNNWKTQLVLFAVFINDKWQFA